MIEFPFPGWVFYGWAINNTFIPGQVSTYTMTGPSTFTPLFSIAKRIHFMTNPPGAFRTGGPFAGSDAVDSFREWRDVRNPVYNLLPPGAAYWILAALCMGDFDFLPGSTHSIGANSPQVDQTGNYWVFQGFTQTASAKMELSYLITPPTLPPR